MNLHESGENYLETILILMKRNGEVRSIDIANELNYTKASVSKAMKQLRENGYATVDKHGLISFTEKGKKRAERIYERHQLLSDFFVSLGVDKETATDDACKIEHIISEKTFQKIKAHNEKLED
jgi:Mn-dependent DtxR family transcriptional regulator